MKERQRNISVYQINYGSSPFQDDVIGALHKNKKLDILFFRATPKQPPPKDYFTKKQFCKRDQIGLSRLERILKSFSYTLYQFYKKVFWNLFLIFQGKKDVLIVQFLPLFIEDDFRLNKRFKRILVYVHGYDVTWNLKQMDGSSYWSPDYLEKVRLKFREINSSNQVNFLVSSNVTKKNLLDFGIEENRIFKLPLIVNLDNPEKIEQTEDNGYILWLGRFIDVKGPLEMLRVYENYRDRGGRLKLIMCGDGPLRKDCELEVIQNNWKADIDIMDGDDRSVVKQLMQEATIFSLHNKKSMITNQEESFGVVYIEAMFFGVPIAVCSDAYISEYIPPELCFVYEGENINNHANLLIKLEQSGYRNNMEFRKKCREFVVNNHSSKKFIEEFRKVEIMIKHNSKC